jgi:type II secretory pathway pseudopilin PulG
MQHPTLRSATGFTLLETIVATGLLVTALAGLAQLFILSSRLTAHSGSRSSAAFAAQSKMEALLSRAFTYTADGDPVTDPALEPSPPDTLSEDVDGFAEALDADGQVIFADEADAGMYVRRWAITPLDDLTPEAFVIEVCVFRSPAAQVPVSGAESCLATIRSRQP